MLSQKSNGTGSQSGLGARRFSINAKYRAPPKSCHSTHKDEEEVGRFDTGCGACHSDIEEQMAARRVHTAFRGGECSDCHNPHASKHAALLTDDKRTLCLSCHQDVAEALTLPSTHPPAGIGSGRDASRASSSATT